MEHAQNTRTVLAAAVLLAATSAGLAGCATVSPAADTVSVVVDHRELVREGADRYVQEQLDRARSAAGHRELVRESADRYVEQLLERARTSTDD